MPDVAKLKKKAAEFELKKQFDKALAVYVEILDSYGPSDEDVDVSLYNRVGDLYLKQGSVGDAVDYYEQAVDRYAEGGFHNNAIALCNKILRQSPGRASVYYKLGKISAQKGFKGDAKKNFLEYADRMQSGGQIDEAFRALKEFADLCPDQDDIRLMLADQLSKKGRGVEAIEQLQLLHERYTEQGRESEARATVDRMKSIDPASEPRTPTGTARRGGDDLVFLDLSDAVPAPKKGRVSSPVRSATKGLEFISMDETPRVSPAIPVPALVPEPALANAPAPSEAILETPLIDPPVLDGVTRVAEFEQTIDSSAGGGLLEGLESTSLGDASGTEQLIDFEPTSFESAPSAPSVEHAGSMSDLLELEMPGDVAEVTSATPSSVADIPFEPLELDETPAVEEIRQTPRQSLMGLPMLVDEEGRESPPEPAAEARAEEVKEQEEEEEENIGGDLPLIIPTPAYGTDFQFQIPAADDQFHTSATEDLPLMDLELPAEESHRTPARASSPDFDLLTPPTQLTPISNDSFDLSTPAPVRRQSTVMAEQSVELLQAMLDGDPDDNVTRRRLAEAMLESGDREGGLRELEAAMRGFERADDLVAASMLADEIILLNPDSVVHQQKRVEYAFRTNDRGRLLEAYLQLADALFRASQLDKSRAIYQRVIDLAPDDLRAQAALESFPEQEAEPEPPPPTKGRTTVQQPRASTTAPVAVEPAKPVPDAEYINFGDWLRDDDAPKDTRMVVEEKEPTGDEEADFQDMLRKFKQGISENVEEEDHQSHYDLGVAYKEMGLLDEAIAEFQKALRAPSNRVPTYEALGLCFIEKEQFPMASTILGRALHEPGMTDDKLVGVLYLLGLCAQQRGQRDAAIEYYQRVFVVDIQFRDVSERLAAVEGSAS